MMTKSMVGIFQDLQANRTDKANAVKRFVVVSLTKKGAPNTVTAQDISLSGATTLEAAEAKKSAMETLNPGKAFTIVAL